MVAAKDLAEVNITSEFSLPNSVETIDEFNLSFFGDKFTAKTTYQISGNGKDEYISFNLYYQGSGFADAQPIKILIDLNSDSNKMLFNAHSGDFDADFSKKHNTGLFITNKNQSRHKQGEREKEYEKSLHSMWSENKADIVFIEQGFINNKKTNYALFRINKIQFRGRYANNLGLHVIIYDDISSGNYWSPAEKIHSFSIASTANSPDSYLTKDEVKAVVDYINSSDKKEHSPPKKNNTKPAVNKRGEGLASNYYNKSKDNFSNLIVVPDGAIRKDQVGEIRSVTQLDKNNSTNNSINFGVETELAVAIAQLKILNLNQSESINHKKLNTVIRKLESILQSKSTDTYRSLPSIIYGVSIGINEVLSLLWPEKGSSTYEDNKMQSKADKVIGFYIDAADTASIDAAKGMKKYLKAEHQRLSLKNRIAASIVARNGTYQTMYYQSRDVFTQIKSSGKCNYDNINSYLNRIWQSGGYSFQSSNKGLFSENEKEDLSISDYNSNFGYERAVKLLTSVSMFSQLTQVYYMNEMLELAVDLEDKVWDWLQKNSVNKNYLLGNRARFNYLLSNIDKEFSKDPFGFNNYAGVDFTLITKWMSIGLTYMQEKDLMYQVQLMSESLQNSYVTQSKIVVVITLVVAFIATALGQVWLSAILAEGSAAFLVASFAWEVTAFAGSGVMGHALMGEKIDAKIITTELLTSLAMVSFMRMAMMGAGRIYAAKYGNTAVMPKPLQYGVSYISLQAFAELSHLAHTGKLMTGDERLNALFSNFVVMLSFGLADKLLIHPLKSRILQTAAREQWFIKHPELAESKTELENLTKRTADLKAAENGKAPSKELTDLIEQTRNAEQKYLAELNNALINANKADLGPDQKKAYQNEAKRLKIESDNAFKEFELTLALAGIVMPADSAGNVDFYPIRPGEIGFSESAREFIKAKFERFEEVTADSGVYLATQKDGSSIIFLSEKGVERKMLENDPDALAGYMRYKNATGKKSVFEVLDAFEGMKFEELKDYFIEYERKAVEKELAEKESSEQESNEQETSEQESTEQESSEQESTEEESSEQESTEEKSTEQESSEQESTEEESSEQESTEQESTEEKSTEQESSEQESTEEESSEQESTEQESTEEKSTEQESTKQESTEEKTTEQESTEQETKVNEDVVQPFTDEQLNYSVSGDIEYLQVDLGDGAWVKLKREAGGEWLIIRRSGKIKLSDAEILGKLPEKYNRSNQQKNRSYITNKKPDLLQPNSREFFTNITKVSEDGRINLYTNSGKKIWASGVYDFIIDQNGYLQTGRGHANIAMNSKSEKVLSAGRIKLDNGRVIRLDNQSGHYRPTYEEFLNTRYLMEKLGIDLSQTRIEITIFDDNGFPIKVLDEHGNEIKK
jgi:hypothetical protein